MLEGKKIVLGITGSIAAYKACLIIRLLRKAGAEVQVVITPAGKEFITPVTLSALTQKPVVSDFFAQRDGTWHSHVALGLWADAMLIAPCTASTLGKMVGGVADNMLVTTYLSMKAPVFVAPAMDLDMYAHPATQRNLESLRSVGNHIIEPGSGFLASGLEGKGRMEDPEKIVAVLDEFFSVECFRGERREDSGEFATAHDSVGCREDSGEFATAHDSVGCRENSGEFATALPSSGNGTPVGNSTLYTLHSTLKDSPLKDSPLKGKRILITAGPTHEKIDPVRFIGNYSSGKMGFALAEECARRGAEVTLVAGPVSLPTPEGCIRRIDVESCLEMQAAATETFATADAAILCAAVADYRPSEQAAQKIKREGDDLLLHLVPNPDIAAGLGRMKREGQLLVGFALETNDEQRNAEQKLLKKNLDFIVLNSLRNKGTCFQSDENQVSIIAADGRRDYEKKPKHDVAADIVDELVRRLVR